MVDADFKKSNNLSFVIAINAVTDDQISMINKYSKSNFDDKCEIYINNKCVYGWSFVENSYLYSFVNDELKLNKKYLYWSNDKIPHQELDLNVLNKKVTQGERRDKLNEIEICQKKEQKNQL